MYEEFHSESEIDESQRNSSDTVSIPLTPNLFDTFIKDSQSIHDLLP